ncbi:Oidioi.mRNA.OKI2018_I69.XSR.g13629.t1.cds [Oikopleura dioica]|uniref:tRNA (guanine(9)-N(1))-methyltransferase n=1 Tax=Oikopleura dioica TaxID=34765 RepID=A0ABN7SBA9_OIKDI|nr:Oidioi.mRNA.OKI2018_I69.XSR.g13629.t1.cds [Oikopleura dioica]
MIEAAGASILTVHGRTIEQKKELTGLASWEHIKAVKNKLTIPVVLNGNIRYFSDVEEAFRETGVDGVMSAEGLLSNPGIFLPTVAKIDQIVDEFIALFEENCGGASLSSLKTFLFRVWKSVLRENPQLTFDLEACSSLEQFKEWNARAGKEFPTECGPFIRKERAQATLTADERRVRNEKRHLEQEAKRKEQKKRKRQERRERKKEEGEKEKDEERVSKKERIQEEKNRLNAASRELSLTIAIDLSYSKSMKMKETKKMAGQLARIHGSNRKSSKPAKIFLTSFSSDDLLYKECERQHEGFSNFGFEIESERHQACFSKEELVVLSPDADEPLESVELGKVYVIGGDLDESYSNKRSLNDALSHQLVCKRLPIEEHLERADSHAKNRQRAKNTILSPNQVFDILSLYNETSDWKKALITHVPLKKGFKLC